MHQLINIKTLQRVASPVEGCPPKREYGDPARWKTPEGYKYVPVIPRPTFDHRTEKIERRVTLEEDGWKKTDLTPEEIAAQKPVSQVSKLSIMRKLQDFGKWQQFKQLLSSLPEEVQDAWTLTTSINSDDPMFLSNAENIKAYLDLSDEEFQSLLEN